MRAIITKYAVTSGLFVVDCDLVKNSSTNMIVKRAAPGNMHECFHGRDWHTNRDAAKCDVRSRFERKRASLSKQLKQLADKMSIALDEIDKAEL